MAANWACETCTFQNVDALPHCEMCNAPKPGVQSVTPGVQDDTDEKWNCQSCTLENESGRLACSCCGSRRFGSRTPLSDVADTSAEIKAPPPPAPLESIPLPTPALQPVSPGTALATSATVASHSTTPASLCSTTFSSTPSTPALARSLSSPSLPFSSSFLPSSSYPSTASVLPSFSSSSSSSSSAPSSSPTLSSSSSSSSSLASSVALASFSSLSMSSLSALASPASSSVLSSSQGASSMVSCKPSDLMSTPNQLSSPTLPVVIPPPSVNEEKGSVESKGATPAADLSVSVSEPSNPAASKVASPENAEFALQRQNLRNELAALQRRICTKGFASKAPFHAKTFLIRELCKEAQQLVERLLQLDWLETTAIAATLQKLNKGGEKDDMIAQPALLKTPQGLVDVALIAQSIFHVHLKYLAKICQIGMCDVHLGPVKELERVISKMGDDPNSGRIFDLNRATVVCKDMDEFNLVMFNLQIVFGRVRQIKNKFKVRWTDIKEPPCMFYQVELGDKANKFAEELEPNSNLAAEMQQKGSQLNQLLESNTHWIVEIQVLPFQFWNTKALCHPIYEVLRVKDLPPWCPMCGTRTDMDAEQEQKNVAPPMCLCLIGATGVGKSSLGNLIGNLPENQQFKASSDIASCTSETLSRVCTWFDDEREFVVMDTPGLGDSSGKDLAHITNMANSLKRQREVSLFVLTFNGEDPRLNDHVQGLLKIFVSMFGAHFLHNTCVVFTHWPHTEQSRLRRIKNKTSEQARAASFNSHFANVFKYSGKPIPCFFLECNYDTSDPLQVTAHNEILSEIKQLAMSLKPFGCQDVQALKDLHAQAEQKLLNLQAELERKEAEAKEKERATEDKVNQILRRVEIENIHRLQDEATICALKEMLNNDEKDAKSTSVAENGRIQVDLEIAKGIEAEEKAARDRALRSLSDRDRRVALDFEAREKEARDKALQAQKVRQEAAALHTKLLNECEQDVDSRVEVLTHQKQLPASDRLESFRSSLFDLQTMQLRLTSGLEGCLNQDIIQQKERVLAKCQSLNTQILALLSDSDVEEAPVVIHAAARQQSPIVVPQDGRWHCSSHSKCALELRSMPYGPNVLKKCSCQRPLTVSFHCASCRFDLCPTCATDFPTKPVWRSAIHDDPLVLRPRRVWNCHICFVRSADRDDGVVYMCDVAGCEFYACVPCAAGVDSRAMAHSRSLGEPVHMTAEISAMWDMIQMLYQAMKPESFQQELPTVEMTASQEAMFLGLATFETAIARSCQVATWDRSVWVHQLSQPQLWSKSYFAIMLSGVQQSLLPSCYNASWDPVAFANLLKNA